MSVRLLVVGVSNFLHGYQLMYFNLTAFYTNMSLVTPVKTVTSEKRKFIESVAKEPPSPLFPHSPPYTKGNFVVLFVSCTRHSVSVMA